MKKRIFAIILAISLLICVIPTLGLQANAAESGITVQDPLRYGWKALSQMDNADSLLFAYEQLINGIANLEPTITVWDDTHSINTTEASTVMDAVRSDYPEFFWLGLGYSYTSYPGRLQDISPQYTMSADQIKNGQAMLNGYTKLLLTGLEDKSDYEISKLLHDRLSSFISYQSTANDQTIYGALVERKAVCAGYAAAYQYLMQQAGIPAWKVTGSSIDPASGAAVGHAWTLVCLDGNWYHTDVTWDDQGSLSNIYYAYLNVTTAQITKDHALNPFFATYLPDCSATAANYFVKNNGQVESFDTTQVANALKAGNLRARFYVTGNIDSFTAAWKSNISAVISQVGISGRISYGWKALGRELILYLQQSGAAATPLGISVTSLPTDRNWEGEPTLDGGVAYIHYSDGSATPVSMTQDMISGFDSKVSGTQVVTVTVQGLSEYFTIYNTAAPEPEALPGDFDADNVITNDDVLTLLWHCLFPEENPININGDFTGDDTITNDDVIKLLWHCLFPDENPL